MPSNFTNSVAVIIAHSGSNHHLLCTFKDLERWFSDITIVGANCGEVSEELKLRGGKWLENKSFNIYELWEAGIREKHSDWYILIQGKEYLSSVLKEAITEAIHKKPVTFNFNPFHRTNFFLKQKLKYNLSWTQEPSSGLLCFPNRCPGSLNEILNLKKSESLKGELIHFGERTLSEVIENSINRADSIADKLYKISSNLNKRALFIGAAKNSLKNFFSTYLIKKGVREGFEGLIFCSMDSLVILWGHLRYYEKYIRSGKQIEDKRDLIKKILVIKVRGLGDAVLATPVLKNLKTFMPNVSISVLTFNFCTALFENNPNVDEIYGLSGNSSSYEIKKIIKTLSDKKFDLIINLHSRNFSSKLAQKIKSDWKINRSYFIREKYTDVMIGSDHELDKTSIERDLDCIRVLGLDPVDKEPELFVTEEENQWAKEKLKEFKIDPVKKLIMIHPACSQDYKNWGMERFVKLSRHLINECGYQVMGIFSSQEQSVADSLEEKVDGIFIYVGPIRPSMALIEQADLMIDNCSGPSHISVALQVPTIVLMGVDFKNTYRDENIYKGKNFLFFREVSCRDLFLSKCLPPDPCQNRICMDHSVEDVFKKAKELLK